MSDLQVAPPSRKEGDNYGSPASMQTMFVENGDELEAVINVDIEEVDAFYDIAWKQCSNRLKVPGYRPGKAPRAMLEQKHGRKIQELVTRSLMDDFYQRSVKRIPGPVAGNPQFFYDKPATFGEPFKFSFVIPKPKGFSQAGGKSLENDGSSEKPSGRVVGSGVPTDHTMGLDKYIEVIEPPELSELTLTRVIIDISDQEIEERFEEYRRSWKMNDDEIAQRLKLSSVTELPGYFKGEIREERSKFTEELLCRQVAMVVVTKSAVVINGRRTEMAKMAKLNNDEESHEEFIPFTTIAVFFKLAELEGLEKEIADTKNNVMPLKGLISSVTKRVIEKATIEEIHLESWAKAEEFIGRLVEQ